MVDTNTETQGTPQPVAVLKVLPPPVARPRLTTGFQLAQFVLLPIVILVLWEAIARAGWVNSLVLPAPSAIATAIYQDAWNGSLWANMAVTLERVAAGFGIAILIAVPAGLVLGTSKVVRRLFVGILELLRPVPPIALIPLSILWLGIGDASKVFIIAFASIWPILLNVILGVESVPPVVRNTARTLGLTGVKYFWKVVLPCSVPQIMVGLRVSGAIAFVVVVAAEMVAATAGLGFSILDAERTFRTPDMFAGIVVLSILGALVNLVLLRLEQAATAKWR